MPLAKNNMALPSLFQFALLSLFLSFTFLFNLFCFSNLYQCMSFIKSPGYLSESKLLVIFAERKKERESRRSPVMRGKSGGTMVIGKL